MKGFLGVLDETIEVREPDALPYGGSTAGLARCWDVRQAGPVLDSGKLVVEAGRGEDASIALLRIPLRSGAGEALIASTGGCGTARRRTSTCSGSTPASRRGEINGTEPPKPLLVIFAAVDRDRARAERLFEHVMELFAREVAPLLAARAGRPRVASRL